MIVVEDELFITTTEIANYLFIALAKLGHVPSEDELEDIADILFDFLIEKGVLEPMMEDDE